ncbi:MULTISPECIES: hypothetical protein [Planktothrix]|uniref:hypothetical protein n=1 Tax=Planktothrix TaxID=54304 RepID=UPI00041050BA|nr:MULTISPECIES: hypothetical protein [Planktothrix]CAD0230025.1 exported hypothetical protein [Planktothrix agardhii]CAD5958170.1 hypothetical protein NO758_02971 [Planktothrix agardhii]
MYHGAIKRALILGLSLLLGCSTAPVTIKGNITNDNDLIPSIDWETRDFLKVWFCPKKVDLAKRSDSKYTWIALSKSEEIADKECLKAVTVKNSSYTLENIPPGRYTVNGIIYVRNYFTWGLDSYWWMFDVRVSKDQQIDLSVEKAFLIEQFKQY